MTPRAAIVRHDLAHVWHPFTQMREYASHDTLVVARGRGRSLVDVDGREYLDGVSSLWCNLFGHRVSSIDRAVRRQLGRIAHSTLLGITNEPAVELARRLVEVAPRGLTRVFYSDDGSTAVEVALKMAFQYWQQAHGGRHRARQEFVTFTNAYHGDTMGSVSLGGIDLFHRVYGPLTFRCHRVPAPYPFRGEVDSLGLLAKTLRAREKRIAAVVLEPRVQGAAGMLVQPPGFVREVRRLCDRHGALLIADEVATGFGRTGTMFAVDAEGVRPDLMCLAKGITGGYLPLAATLTTNEVYRAFQGRYEEFRTFFHGHTYTGNPLGCAAGIATLDLLARPATWEALARGIEALGRELTSLWAHPLVGDIRRAGLMTGIELVADRETRRPFPSSRRVGYRVCLAARRHGVLLRPLGDVVVINPPLTTTPAEMRRIVRAVKAGLESWSRARPTWSRVRPTWSRVRPSWSRVRPTWSRARKGAVE